MLAGAARVAGIVHLAIAHRCARFDLADAAAFGVFVRTAIQMYGIVADEARAGHVGTAVGSVARSERLHIGAFDGLASAPRGHVVGIECAACHGDLLCRMGVCRARAIPALRGGL
jgi:hypothetical protein